MLRGEHADWRVTSVVGDIPKRCDAITKTSTQDAGRMLVPLPKAFAAAGSSNEEEVGNMLVTAACSRSVAVGRMRLAWLVTLARTGAIDTEGEGNCTLRPLKTFSKANFERPNEAGAEVLANDNVFKAIESGDVWLMTPGALETPGRTSFDELGRAKLTILDRVLIVSC